MKRLLLLIILISSMFSLGEVVEIEKRDAFINVPLEEVIEEYMDSHPFIPSELNISLNKDISVLDLFK